MAMQAGYSIGGGCDLIEVCEVELHDGGCQVDEVVCLVAGVVQLMYCVMARDEVEKWMK